MAKIPLAPNDRYALVGKTGSGKTSFATVLATSLIPVNEGDWQCWWLDTKQDAKDIQRLQNWGFLHVNSYKRDVPKKIKKHNLIYFPVASKPGGGPSVATQCQQIIQGALRRRKVLLVVDEYTHVVVNTRDPGKSLGDAFRTGRGIGVGIIGCTQEPVYVPRQLLSQAGHVFLFDLHYPKDIKYIQELYEEYLRPNDVGDQHGFFTSHLDSNTGWRYYKTQRDWYEQVIKPVDRPRQATKSGEVRP